MNLIAPKSSRRWVSGTTIAVFLALLALPTVDFFSGIDVTRPADENRLPAPKPQLTAWSFSGVRNFLSGAEAYFNDHFGFRKRLIRWCQQWKSRLYHDESGHKVLLGQHGWMFSGELQMIEHYLGIAKFTPAQLQSWEKLLEKRRDWLAARGIPYLFIIAPDKQDIYPEELPAWLQAAAPPNRETKLDQFLRFMRVHSTVPILDLRPVLLAAKKTAPLYLQNDSHWNFFGGFVAAQATIKTVGEKIPGVPPLRLEDFTWTNPPLTGGDLSRLIGREPREKNYFFFQPKPGVIAPNVRPATNLVSAWGQPNVGLISETAAPLAASAVIFHDSFGIPWQTFFGYSFKRIVFMFERREFNPGVIAQNHPQIVINEMLERYFNALDPEEMMAKDALP